jgi:hypothetical protein
VGETVPAVARDGGGTAFPSASPSKDEERCRGSITISSDAAEVAASNVLSRSKAAQSTTGLSARRRPQQIARSNIHCGISKLLDVMSPASRPQRFTATPFLTNDSRITNDLPYQGCHG